MDNNYAELHGKAQGIGLMLGWQYKQPAPNESQRWATLVGPDGASISVSQVWNQKGRLQISCHFPGGNWGAEKRPIISVSISKRPEDIARDIERRLLPAYLPLYQKAVERLRAEEEREAADLALAARLAAILGVEPLGTEINWYGTGDFRGGSGTIRVSGGNVSFDLRWIDPEKAEAIINILKGNQ